MSDGPVAEAATCTTKTNTKDEHPHPKRDSNSPIPAIKRPHTYALDRALTGTNKTLDLTEMYLTFI